jgi:hypothetical protein
MFTSLISFLCFDVESAAVTSIYVYWLESMQVPEHDEDITPKRARPKKVLILINCNFTLI